MKAYQFQTKIKQGLVEIPKNYLEQLKNDKTVRVIILMEEENYPQPSNGKLSEALLLPELESNEDLFPRDKDTGRETVL